MLTTVQEGGEVAAVAGLLAVLDECVGLEHGFEPLCRVADLVADCGELLEVAADLASVTMSRIAEETGIGRATLYKYFPDVEAILAAWHERQISGHLQQLAAIGHQAGNEAERLESVLQAYALIQYGQHEHNGSELAALLHRGEHVVLAQQQLHNFISNLLADGAKAGDLRDDVAPGELASYCLHALTAASSLPSKAAVHRLVAVTMAGLRLSADRS